MRALPVKVVLALVWLLQAAVLGFAAAVETAVPAGYAYPRVAVGWASPLPAAFSELASAPNAPNLEMAGSLAKLDLKNQADRQSLAPVVDALTHDLGLSPEKFMALKPADRSAALAMALDEARGRLETKVQYLTAQARDSSWAVQPGDREAQAKLYDTLAALGEIRRFYGAFLTEESRAAVAEGYRQANSRALEIREALVRQAGKGAEVLAAAPAKAAAPAVVMEFAKPSATAVKLLEDMKNTRSGWGLDDFRTLYKGYGFIETQGGKHVKFTHSAFPELVQHVSRGRSLAPGYAVDAVKMIERLEKMQAERAPPATAAAQAPQEIPLAELKFLLDKPPIEVPGKTAASRKHDRKAAARAEREKTAAQAKEIVVETPPVAVAAAPVSGERVRIEKVDVAAERAAAQAQAEAERGPAPIMTLQPAAPRQAPGKVELPQPEPPTATEAPAAGKRTFWEKLFFWR